MILDNKTLIDINGGMSTWLKILMCKSPILTAASTRVKILVKYLFR